MDNFSDLNNMLIGLKQCKKAAAEGKIKTLYVALDADDKITAPVARAARDSGAEIVEVSTMEELGKSLSIDVGASLAAKLR